MLLKILRKDLKRKKTMNIILAIFMLTASVLIASSSNLLYSTVTAVDYFIGKSQVSDLILVTGSDEEVMQPIRDWAAGYKVQNCLAEAAVIIEEEMVTASTGKELKNTSSLILMAKPEKYNLVFNQEGEDFSIGIDQVAVPVSIQKKMGLKPGDSLTIESNGIRKTFTVSNIFKDAVLGAELMGMKRILLNEEDFLSFKTGAKEEDRIAVWGITGEEGISGRDLEDEFADLIIPTYGIIPKETISTAYVLDMVLAIIMIIFSVFLILISFLILRFTIVFTVMEDYKQIGVMKAIGLQNRRIRTMYSVKYLLLAFISGILGFGASIPISGVMKRNISDYILLTDSFLSWIIAGISVALVVFVTCLFCNYATGKVKKISAIEAIRQGNSGERFKNSKKLRLHSRRIMNVPVFLAFSDIASDFKKFIILVVTFILGTAIIIIPNNIISTLNSDRTITFFGYTYSDFYIRNTMIGNQEEAIQRLNEMEEEFREAGVTTTLRADLITQGKIIKADRSDNISILAFQGVGVGAEEYEYLEGAPPVLDNELAVTEKTARELGLRIGDSVLCEVQGDMKEYIITAYFQTFNNLGNGVRMPESYNIAEGDNTTVQISGLLSGSKKEKEEQLKKLTDFYPEYSIKKGKEVVNTFIGSITEQMGAIKNLILFIVLGVNFLITSLLLRLLVSKEVPEIAILKSLGFRNSGIKKWQIYRIGIILLFSIFVGTLLANGTGNFLAAGIFEIMGVTRLKLIIEPVQVFILYPVVLFAITMTAVAVSLRKIKKTNVWELNNQE